MSRVLLITAMALLTFPTSALFAQRDASCAAVGAPRTCGCNRPNCATCCRTPCQKPPAPPAPPAYPQSLPYEERETGQYVAPLQAGAAQGAVNHRGLEGGGITFPELRLRLPRIELPGLFHSRSGARMILEGTEAAWQSTGFANVHSTHNEAMLLQRVAQLEQQLAQGAPATTQSEAEALQAREAAERLMDATEEELRRLRCEVNRLRGLEEALKDYQQRASQSRDCSNGFGPHAAPDKGGYDLPPPPTPTEGAARPAAFPARPVVYNDRPAPVEPVIREPVTPARIARLPATGESQAIAGQRASVPVIREPASTRRTAVPAFTLPRAMR